MSARLRAWFHSASVAPAPFEATATDGDLVRRFTDTRDEAAFAELVRRHGPMVLATCRRVLHPDVHTADDAFQAAFLVLATKAAAVSPPERVGAWLHGVAVHVAKKARSWVRKVASAPLDPDKVPAAPIAANPDTADLRAELDDVLAGLPAKYRSAVILCELEGRSRAEAAAALGWREGTLSSRLARARKLLADRLARRGVTLPAAGLGVLRASAATASVPVRLAASTVRAATLVAAGAATEEVPASVAALAQGVPDVHSNTFKLITAGIVGMTLALGGLHALTPTTHPAPDKPLFTTAPVPRDTGWVVRHTFTFKGPVTAVAFGPGLVAAGDKGGALVLWDPKTGKQKYAVEAFEKGSGYGAATPAQSIDLLRPDPFGEKVSVAADGGRSISRFAVGQKDRVEWEVPNGDRLKALGLTPDGKYWLHASSNQEDKEFRLLITPNGLGETDGFGNRFIFTRKIGEFRFEHPGPLVHAAADGLEAVATVTVPNGDQPKLRFWRKGSDGPLWAVNLNSWTTEFMHIGGVLVSPGGKRVAIFGDSHGRAGRVWVFDATTGTLVTKLRDFTGTVRAAAFGPDGTQIVAGCDDGTVRICDVETGEERAVLKGHTEAVTAVAFGPDGKQIVTGSADKTVKVWQFR
jgi:RNA polymerase sigma factor (sigma-70 family)